LLELRFILFYLVFGALSDRIGRKPVIIAGCILAAVTLFPAFHLLTQAANPALAAAQEAAMHEDPLVKAVMAAFPQARIIDAPGSAEPGAQPWSRRA
jgi:MFS family permease